MRRKYVLPDSHNVPANLLFSVRNVRQNAYRILPWGFISRYAIHESSTIVQIAGIEEE
jgi:hypothetical protein